MSAKKKRDAEKVNTIISQAYQLWRLDSVKRAKTPADLVVGLRELRTNIVDNLAKAGFSNLAISEAACEKIDAKIALLTSQQPEEVQKAALTFEKKGTMFIPFRKVKKPKARMRMMKPPESN